MAGLAKKCPCLRPKIDDEVRILDYKHSNLYDVPVDVFNKERTLEELSIDSNQIRDLPRELFFCHGLRKLSISDNELTSIPSAISGLTNLEELDFSKNGIIDVPDSIKGCKYLRSINASINPLGKLPEGFTCLPNLTHLYLNDTFLDYLPGSCGRMVKLKILELRENHIKSLPKSFSRLVNLERLDIGNNEFIELGDVLGGLQSLLELWCDNNQIVSISRGIGQLKNLMFMDVSNNQLQELPKEIGGCLSLADLHITSNNLAELPDTIGNLKNLITLKVDDNQLVYLPRTLGGLSSLSELNVSTNDLKDLPAGIGLLKNLRTFYADDNLLRFLPAEIGSCSGITVLSLRCNKLTYIPDELSRISRLRVLNLSDNLLQYLPFSIIKLKELQALWLTENQTRPLIPLQSEYEVGTGRKILTCYLLPQGELKNNDVKESLEDTKSFHSSFYDEERLHRQQIHFDFVDGSDEEGTLVRCPTPHPKDLKKKSRHAQSLTMKAIINSGDGMRPNEDVNRQNYSNQSNKNTNTVMNDEVNYSKLTSQSDIRDHESYALKPTSQKQESHHLYRHDKELIVKDRAHLQHRISVPDVSIGLNDLLTSAQNTSKKVSPKDNRLFSMSGSAPNLSFSCSRKTPSSENCSKTLPFSTLSPQEGLHYEQIFDRHKGRRSRRMRDYNSDTDYCRSDYELIRYNDDDCKDNLSQGTNFEVLSVQSQPIPHRYYHHDQLSGRWQETPTRCTSDLKGYSSSSCCSFQTANAAAAAFQKKFHHQNQFLGHSSLYPIVPSRTSTPDSTKNCLQNFLLNSNQTSISRLRDYKENGRPKSDYSLNIKKFTSLNDSEVMNYAVSNDELYNHKTNRNSQQQFHTNFKDFHTTNEHCSSSHKLSTSTHNNINNLPETPFQPYLTSGPILHIPTDFDDHHSPVLNGHQSPALSGHHLPAHTGHHSPALNDHHSPAHNGHHSPALNDHHSPVHKHMSLPHSLDKKEQPQMYPNKSDLHNISGGASSLQQSSRSSTPSLTVNNKDNSTDQSEVSSTSQALLSYAQSDDSLNFPTANDYNRSSKLCTVLEEGRPTQQRHTYSDQSVSPTQPSSYNSARAYRSSGRLEQSMKRQSKDRPYVYGDSSHYATRVPITTTETSSPLISSLINTNLISNQPKYPSTKFYDSIPYADFPPATKEKLSFSNYADVDHQKPNKYGSIAYDEHRDNNTRRSSNCHSQIEGDSNLKLVNISRVNAEKYIGHSDTSDSQSDLQNVSLSHEFPSDPTYESSHACSGDERPHNPLCHSFDHENFDELSMIPNQEQSSQVSSSTDSGYDHGHHVYELIGDHLTAKSDKYSNGKFNERELNNPVTSSCSPQKSTPKKMPGRINSQETTTSLSASQRHKTKFQITIKKNPGLGFSIAGGIGSHGNPFREKDIGIFVTKVIPEGPAAKSLRPGDKILEVNKVDFQVIEHNQAVAVLKKNNIVTLLIERIQKVKVV